MGLELENGAAAPTATAAESGAPLQSTEPAASPRVRKPRDPADYEKQKRRRAAKALLNKLDEAQSEEELFAKLEEVRSAKTGARPAPRMVDAKPGEVVQLRSPEDLAREAAAKLQAAQEQVAMMVAGVAEVVKGTPYEIDEKRSGILVVGLAPWAAENTDKLSPKAAAIGALAMWLVPPTVKLAVDAGKAWWSNRKATA